MNAAAMWLGRVVAGGVLLWWLRLVVQFAIEGCRVNYQIAYGTRCNECGSASGSSHAADCEHEGVVSYR